MSLGNALKQWPRAVGLWRRVWSDYGGWRCMLLSPYFGVAVVLALGCFPLWSEGRWIAPLFAIVPTMLGFAVGGFAIFLAFGDERFRTLIAGESPRVEGNEPGPEKRATELSPFMSVCVQFGHFIGTQVGALMLAIVGTAAHPQAPSWATVSLGGLGTLALTYSLTVGLAAVGSLLKMSRSFDTFITRKKASAAAPDESR